MQNWKHLKMVTHTNVSTIWIPQTTLLVECHSVIFGSEYYSNGPSLSNTTSRTTLGSSRRLWISTLQRLSPKQSWRKKYKITERSFQVLSVGWNISILFPAVLLHFGLSTFWQRRLECRVDHFVYHTLGNFIWIVAFSLFDDWIQSIFAIHLHFKILHDFTKLSWR